MTQPRELPICLPPAEGEAFASWLDRAAADLGLPLITLLDATGQVSEQHYRNTPRGYGVTLTPHQLAAFAFTTGRPLEEIQATLLTAYDGTAYDFAGIDLHSGAGLRELALAKWVYASGSRLCAGCIAEDAGIWQLAWRLFSSFACVRHNTLLLDTCPGCGRYFRTAGKTETGPTFPSQVPTPTCCGNAQAAVNGQRGAPSRCGFDLTKIESTSLAHWPRLAEVQADLDRIIGGEAAVVAGEAVSSVSFFGDLKALVTLSLQVAMPEDLGGVPETCKEAFARVARARAKIQAHGIDGRGGSPDRLRFFVHVPRNPALIGGLLPLAHHILTAPTNDALFERVAWLADRIRSHGRKRLEEMPAQAHASEPLAAVFSSFAGPPAKFTSRAGIHSLAAEEKRVRFDLNPAYVPALYWTDRYERRFAKLLEPMRERSGRRLCSITLVKACGGYGWKEAATLLGYPPDVYRRLTSNLVFRLNETGAAEHFWAALRTEAAELAMLDEHVDFGSRRRALEALREIDCDVWAELCARSGVRRGGEPKRRSAVAWLWAELTGGDPWVSPARLQWEQSRTRRAYEYFVITGLPPMRDALLAYGEELLVVASTTRASLPESRSGPDSEHERTRRSERQRNASGHVDGRESAIPQRRLQTENVA